MKVSIADVVSLLTRRGYKRCDHTPCDAMLFQCEIPGVPPCLTNDKCWISVEIFDSHPSPVRSPTIRVDLSGEYTSGRWITLQISGIRVSEVTGILISEIESDLTAQWIALRNAADARLMRPPVIVRCRLCGQVDCNCAGYTG